MEHRCAAIVPVGPKAIDLWRAAAVIESLQIWEPSLRWCVVVDDAPKERGLEAFVTRRTACRLVTILNPRRGRDGDWRGCVTAGIFTALAWIHAHTDADFALKIDTDALAIGPFAASIRAFVAGTPDAGLVGTLGMSCNPRVRAMQKMSWEPLILQARRRWPMAPAGDSCDDLEIEGFGHVSALQRRSFDAVRPHVEAAVANGYNSFEYCQGGAVAFTSTMVNRMAAAGYLARPEYWIPLRFWGDQTLAMYARAVGLRLYDYSQPGEPFGVQYQGLAYSPEEIVARGHSLIHSLKNDQHVSEAELREFFTARARLQIASSEGMAVP